MAVKGCGERMKKTGLESCKGKTVTLEKLFSMGYGEENILALAESNALIPVKASGTNGNKRTPLYKKYRIAREEKDCTEALDIIKTLHPKLIANGYLLKKPTAFEENSEALLAVNRFLQNCSQPCFISRRERSYEIFGDEKYLDKNLSLMRSVGLTEKDLRFYTTPEQCFADYIPVRKENMTLLICENKDIWFNIRRIMSGDGRFDFFGVRFDGVIFGQGNDITGKGKFSSYASFLGSDDILFFYCGDIDRAGFDIFFRLCSEARGLDIRLFLPVYKEMLRLSGDISRLPDSDDERGIDVDTQALSKVFSVGEMSRIKEILDSGKRLPQEVINYSVLNENAR